MSFRRWIVSLFWGGVVVVIALWIPAALEPGDTYLERLEAAYRRLWTSTTGQQYTDMMRDNPWLLIVPAIVIIVFAGWILPRRYWGRAIMFYLTFGIGFLSGHVFW
jgi:hypothetical protein